MKSVLFAAAVLAVPAVFAQSTTVTTTTTTTAPALVVSAANSPVSDFPFMRYQNSVVAAESGVVAPMVVSSGSNTAVMGAPAGPVVRYWWNVPSDIGQRDDFRRWRGLR